MSSVVDKSHSVTLYVDKHTQITQNAQISRLV